LSQELGDEMDGSTSVLDDRVLEPSVLERLRRLAACAAAAEDSQVMAWWRLARRPALADYGECIALGLEREAHQILVRAAGR